MLSLLFSHVFLFIAHFSATQDGSVFALPSVEMWRRAVYSQVPLRVWQRKWKHRTFSPGDSEAKQEESCSHFGLGIPHCFWLGRDALCKDAASYPLWGQQGAQLWVHSGFEACFVPCPARQGAKEKVRCKSRPQGCALTGQGTFLLCNTFLIKSASPWPLSCP